MNVDSEVRMALRDRMNIINLLQPEKPSEPQQNPKSQRKASLSQNFKRLSLYSKDKNQIPSAKQAKYRQKQIKYFHNRTFYKRKSQLQDIFKENMRLYQQLNKQKSYYEINFKTEKNQKKSKKVHAISCTDNYTTKYIDMDKGSADENFDERRTHLERRFSFSVGKSCKHQHQKDRENEQNSRGMTRPESDFAINIRKRYEKNKTQMLPRKNRLKIQKSCEFSSFNQVKPDGLLETQKIENFIKNDKIFTASKNPGYIRMKKRPSSGFRI